MESLLTSISTHPIAACFLAVFVLMLIEAIESFIFSVASALRASRTETRVGDAIHIEEDL